MFVESVEISYEGKALDFKLFIYLQPHGIKKFVYDQEKQAVLMSPFYLAI